MQCDERIKPAVYTKVVSHLSFIHNVFKYVQYNDQSAIKNTVRVACYGFLPSNPAGSDTFGIIEGDDCL